MTMPNERTRALRWAGEFLKEVMHSAECPEAIRHQAHVILRHYPEAWEIAHQARCWEPRSSGTPWLGPEDHYEGHGA